jgi:hypothetical protein
VRASARARGGCPVVRGSAPTSGERLKRAALRSTLTENEMGVPLGGALDVAPDSEQLREAIAEVLANMGATHGNVV